MKILIIRFSSIGDIVLTSPIIRAVKNKFPDAEIHYLTKPQFAICVQNNPFISKVILLSNNEQETIRDLKQEKYNILIDLHKNIRTLRIKTALSISKSYSFNKLNFKKWILTNFKKDLLPPISIVDRYFIGLQPLRITNDGLGLDFFLDNKKKYTLPFDLQVNNYIALSIGGQYTTKKMPLQKWIELVDLLPKQLVILGGKEDVEWGEKIKDKFPDKVINLCGLIPLDESAFVIQQSKAIITHDTGLMHIAAALQKPIISIWGNTVPKFGFFPYFAKDANKQRELSKIIEVLELSCRPCSKIGYKSCPKKHFKCMENINIQEIKNAIDKIVV